MRSINHTNTSRLIKMRQIKSKQTIIFKHRINFINEVILYKILKSNRWVKLNQSKLKAWIFKYRIDFINDLKLYKLLKYLKWINLNKRKLKQNMDSGNLISK